MAFLRHPFAICCLLAASALVLDACERAQEPQQVLSQATALAQQGKYTEEENLLRRQLKASAGVKDRQLRTAMLDMMLSDSLCRQNKFAQAEAAANEAVAIYENRFGKTDVQVAEPLDRLRHVYYKEEQYEKAEFVARHALAILQRLPDRKDPRLEFAISHVLLVACRPDHQCTDEADLCHKLVEARTARFGKSAPATMQARQQLAKALLRHGMPKQAIVVLQENVAAAREGNPAALPLAQKELSQAKDSSAQAGH